MYIYYLKLESFESSLKSSTLIYRDKCSLEKSMLTTYIIHLASYIDRLIIDGMHFDTRFLEVNAKSARKMLDF